MALIDDVKRACRRLAEHGWGELLQAHGLDITADDLTAEFTRELPRIDRELPGFEDFALEGHRGIEPGVPARSLLFHALASPYVLLRSDGTELGAFPTPAEIESVEDYIYAARRLSLPDLRQLAGGAPMAIACFSHQYRPALDSVHGRHADVCFSRTGVARVGTEAARYEPARRGHLPEGSSTSSVRVLPARYSAYVAVQLRGGNARIGPMDAQEGDEARAFWVPLHKLFSGTECLLGRELSVTLEAHHRNEKLRRFHLELLRRGIDAGWREPELSTPPFSFTEEIAKFSTEASEGRGLLVPVPHPLVEPAVREGRPLTYRVPERARVLSSSLYISDVAGARRAPEYVHARTLVREDGSEENLNTERDVVSQVDAGGYQARHYLDFLGDGWIQARCPELATEFPRNIPAYSLVTAPDFFPLSGQRELLEWTRQSVPERFRRTIWVVEPATLAHRRLPPNLQLPGAPFRAEDTTVTAIVSAPWEGSERQARLIERETLRHLHLPDTASGEFAPGWDVSMDRTEGGVEHLATYGLGSPFPEDAKLCAALSTFWPAVAPDAARTFQPSPLWAATNSWPTSPAWPTVAPLTDVEIGLEEAPPWDGVTGPRLVQEGGQALVEYTDIAHADYVLNVLAGDFSLALTSQVGSAEYRARVLYMARVYAALGITDMDFDSARRKKAEWSVFSFRPADGDDEERRAAESAIATSLEGLVFAFRLYRFGGVRRHPTDVRKVRVEIREWFDAFVDPVRMLVRRDSGDWVLQDA
jgi:hypothetical protein